MRMRNPLLIQRLAIRILLLGFAGLQTACASTPSLRPCEAAGCYTTAKPAPWPTEVVAGGVALRFHELSMIAPAEFSAINAQPDAIFAKYAEIQRSSSQKWLPTTRRAPSQWE